MSEYQYYEFQAVDRPLTDKEMGELRSYSTRARITPTSFINDYSLIATKQPKDYDQALKTLIDLETSPLVRRAATSGRASRRSGRRTPASRPSSSG